MANYDDSIPTQYSKVTSDLYQYSEVIFILFCMISLYVDLVFNLNYFSLKLFVFILMIFLIFVFLPVKSIKMSFFKNLN